MARGRPRKIKPVPQPEPQPQGEEMAEAKKATALKSDPNIPPKDTIGTMKNVCAWCNYSNDDELKGPLHKKEDNLVRNVGHKYQCDTCGKMWKKEELGKPWSEGLERGPEWVKEMRIRELQGR